ncbi:MAG: ATP-dependent DNA ligase [Nanoarchaeota archaeon]
MKYLDLVEVYERLGSTTKRISKTYVISLLLKDTPAADLPDITLLAQGRLFPYWDQTEIGVAAKIVIKAIALASGESKEKIDSLWAKTGDLGKVAEELSAKRKQQSLFSADLTVKKVVTNLRKLATLQGAKSVDLKVKLIAELLTSAQPLEAKYVVRTVLGDLRVGVGEGSLRDAIAWAFFPPVMGIFFRCPSCEALVPVQESCIACKAALPKKFEEEEDARERYKSVIGQVQHAYDVVNDFGVVAQLAKEKGLAGLGQVDIQAGKPLKVMLAQKVKDAEEGLKSVGIPAEVEFKYDGFRMQVHKTGGKIILFTRRLENVTAQFPDVVATVKQQVKGEEFILDAEACGFDPETGRYLPFQNISQRIRRKYDIKELSEKLPVELNVFDCLFFNGKSVIKQPFTERKRILKEHVIEAKQRIRLAECILAKSVAEVESFYRRALAAGMEGVMLKKLDAEYKPGSRVGFMVKLKPVMDSLDLVIVGAEWGEGKRAHWLTSFTLACVDDDGEYLEIGKVGTGVKELESEGLTFSQLTEMLRPHIVKSAAKEVSVKPMVVVEVNYEEIQKSPTYSSGFALRFPRVVQVREDRAPEDASPISLVKEYYNSQKSS